MVLEEQTATKLRKIVENSDCDKRENLVRREKSHTKWLIVEITVMLKRLILIKYKKMKQIYVLGSNLLA